MGKTLKCELESTQVQLEGIRSGALFGILSIGGVKCVFGGAIDDISLFPTMPN